MSVAVPNAWLPTTHIGHACIFGTTAPFAFSRLAWFFPPSPRISDLGTLGLPFARLSVWPGIFCPSRIPAQRKPEWIRLTVIDSGFSMGLSVFPSLLSTCR